MKVGSATNSGALPPLLKPSGTYVRLSAIAHPRCPFTDAYVAPAHTIRLMISAAPKPTKVHRIMGEGDCGSEGARRPGPIYVRGLGGRTLAEPLEPS